MAGKKTEKQFSSVSDIGQIRTSNQDFFGNKEEVDLFLVADGMGGHAGGERASRLAVDTVLNQFTFEDGKKPNIKSIKEILSQSIKAATRAIYEEASQNQELQQMGTTIVALVLHGRNAILGHVGDSRIYRLRNSHLEQLTVDHSFVQEQIDAGIISEKDSKDHRMKNVITRALGVDSDVEVDINTTSIQEGDVFLLCTDGLHGMASDSEIVELMLTEPDLEKCCQALIDLANKNGGKDNVTATLVRVEKVASETLSKLAKILAVPLAAAAVLAIALYLYSSVFTQKPSPMDEDVPPPDVPGNLTVDSVPEKVASPADAEAAEMLARATEEVEKGNLSQARTMMEKILTLCMSQDCRFEISDIENPRLRDMAVNLQNVTWARQLKAVNEKLEKQRDTLEKYAPEKMEASVSKLSQAEAAFRGNELFLALRLLNDAHRKMDDASRAFEQAENARKVEAENILAKAEQQVAKMSVYKGESYKEISREREIVAAIIVEAKRRLKTGKYDEAIKDATNVLDRSRKILAKAAKIEKTVKAAEQRKANAAAISEKVKKKWEYIKSEQFVSVGMSLSSDLFSGLAADHKKFEAQLRTGDHEKTAAMGDEFISKADTLVRNTAAALKKQIERTEANLLEKKDSGKNYDKTDFVLGASLLDEAKVLADLFPAKSYEKIENLEELLSSMKVKETTAPIREVPGEPEEEEPQLSALDVQKIVLASQEAGVLESYLKRCLELLNDGKKTRAKSLLKEHSKAQFEKVSSLLAENQNDLRSLLDEAYELCLNEGVAPEVSTIEKALDNIQRLKKQLDQVAAANQS